MPTPLQQPSTRRKLVYFALIFALFVVNTFFWRGLDTAGGQSPFPWSTITARANDLELRELTRGEEAELLGSTVRLGLTGSRGLAVTILWSAAIEKQKKNEWNELELIVRSLTKLQPHFLTPWLFQSWNLAYNVSVESDRVKDKYFYISRGIELLAQGERLNRDNPDMRYWTGFYYMNKFGVSDEANSLRSLYQLSCIEPSERDPARFRPDGRTVDLAAFEQFVTKHPQLVHRLREPPRELTKPFRCNTPDEVVDFLADNRKLPTRYVDPVAEGGLFQGRPGDLKPIDQQFPILPAREPVRFTDAKVTTALAPTLGDDFDNYEAARCWFCYSQDPLPDAEIMTELKDRIERVAGQKGRRLPRQPAEVIFRQQPARAQSYTAERLLKEGWFDASGWEVDEGRSGRNRWFPGKKVTVGTGVNWLSDAWGLAHKMWREHGLRTGLYIEFAEQSRLEQLAEDYRKEFGIGPNDMGPDLRPGQGTDRLRRSYLAHRTLFFANQSRSITNFPHHYFRALTEQDPQTVLGRKLMAQADRYRDRAVPEEAIKTYQEAFKVWKEVLTRYPDFRQDEFMQEQTYEAELRYLDQIREHRGLQLRPALITQGVLTEGVDALQAAFSPAQFAVAIVHALVDDAKGLPLPVPGPMDGPGPDGKPWLSPSMVRTTRQKLGLPVDQLQVPTSPPEPAAPTDATPAPAPRREAPARTGGAP
jgi:hypothetical protein